MNVFYRFKNRGKIYYNNLFLVLVLISAMVIALFVYVLISNNKHIHSEVMSSENRYLDYYNAYACSEFDSICMLAINLSTTVLEPEYNLEATRNNIEKNIVKSYMVQNTEICGISMIYDNTYLEVGTLSKGFTKKINSYKNVDFYCNPEFLWPANIQLIYNNNRNDTTKVIIEISLRRLSEEINRNISGSENRELHIITEDGIILSSTDIRRIFTNLGRYVDNYKFKDNSINKIEQSRGKYFLITKKAQVSGFYVLNFVDTSVYNSSIRQNIILVCLLGVAFLCISIIVSYVISVNTYKPIKGILKSLSSKLPDCVSTMGSEVVLINSKIKELLDSNDELQQSLSKKIETLKQIQLMALQSQINPHFLYNTLDSLRWISIDFLGDNNPIEKNLINVSSIYKASVDYKVHLISLREEIQLSRSYIEIMLLRFGSKFDVEWQVDESALDFKVLRFILQPLIENAFVHGKRENGKTLITVRVIFLESYLQLEVIDNGCGIDEYTLKSIKEDFKKNNITDVCHLGTGNINMRLHLLYGGHYRFDIESNKGKGTKCVISIEREYLE